MEEIDALVEQQAELDGFVAGLDEAGWQRPSACAGWSVSDVVLHLAQTQEMALGSVQGRFGEVAEALTAGLVAAGTVAVADPAAAADLATGGVHAPVPVLNWTDCAAEFGPAEHADFMAAIGREPRLLARLMDISRDREQQLAGLIATREGTTPEDVRAVAAVQVVATILRTAGARLRASRTDGGDFATAITEALAAVRTVTAVSTPDLEEIP